MMYGFGVSYPVDLPSVKAAASPPPDNTPDILREGLDYLLEHVTECRADCCHECYRLHRVSDIMLEMFTAHTVARVAGCGTE